MISWRACKLTVNSCEIGPQWGYYTVVSLCKMFSFSSYLHFVLPSASLYCCCCCLLYLLFFSRFLLGIFALVSASDPLILFPPAPRLPYYLSSLSSGSSPPLLFLSVSPSSHPVLPSYDFSHRLPSFFFPQSPPPFFPSHCIPPSCYSS